MAPYYKNPPEFIVLYATAWMGTKVEITSQPRLECICLSHSELDAAQGVKTCLQQDFGDKDPMLEAATRSSYPLGPNGAYNIYELHVPAKLMEGHKIHDDGPLYVWNIANSPLWKDIYLKCLKPQKIIQIECPRLHPKPETELPLIVYQENGLNDKDLLAQFTTRAGIMPSTVPVEKRSDPVPAIDASFADFVGILKRGPKV